MAENGLCAMEFPEKLEKSPFLAKPEIVTVTKREHV